MQLCLTMIFFLNLPECSSVFVQGFGALHDKVSTIAKLSALMEITAQLKKQESFHCSPGLLDAENFQKTKGF